MGIVFIEIIVILMLILVNSVLAMSEIAVVSSRKSRLRRMAESGSKRAAAAMRLADDPGRFLATVQVGITLVGVLAGTFGGATIANVLDSYFEAIPGVAGFSEALAIGIVVLAITYMSVVFGELVPKQLALRNAEVTASRLAAPMTFLSRMTRPVVWLLESSSSMVVRLFGNGTSKEPEVSEEEIKSMIEHGTHIGVFKPGELDLVKGVFRLADRHVTMSMTPRVDFEWLDIDQALDSLAEKARNSNHNRFPVARGSLDQLLGVVEAKVVLALALSGGIKLEEQYLQKPLFVSELSTTLVLLEQLKIQGAHMAFAVDEYGVVVGLVTSQDLLGAILGDLSPDASPAQMIVRCDDGSFLVDAMAPFDLFHEIFPLPVTSERKSWSTLAGYILENLKRIPDADDELEIGGYILRIASMDGRRIDKVLIRGKREGPPEGSQSH